MSKIKQLIEEEYVVLYHETDIIKDIEYLFTLRQTQDGKFISDESILDLWLDRLDKISWVNPNADFKYALEVYEKRYGYFTSIAPVILCDKQDKLTLDNVKKLFKDLKKPIEKQVEKSNELTQKFGHVLESNGFSKQLIGGGCSIKI